MDRSMGQNLSKETTKLTQTTGQMGLIDNCRTFHPTDTEYNLVSLVHGILYRVDYIIGYKNNLSQILKINSSVCISFESHEVKLETSKSEYPEDMQILGD